VNSARRETASEWRTKTVAQRVLDDGPAADDLSEHAVSVISSALLRAAQRIRGEDRESFAIRAGVATAVVTAAEDGTRPAWALPYDAFMALTDATAVCGALPAFEIAAASDLLLTCVLNGEQVFATDVLVEPSSRDLAWALLRLAIGGDLHHALPWVGNLTLPDDVAVLSDTQVMLLRDQTGALAASGSPDAWVAAEILAACWGERS